MSQTVSRHLVLSKPPTETFGPKDPQLVHRGKNGYYCQYIHNTIIEPIKQLFFKCINPINQKYKWTLWAIWTQGRFLSMAVSHRTKYQEPADTDQLRLWIVLIGPNLKDLLAWTRCLYGCFGQDKYPARVPNLCLLFVSQFPIQGDLKHSLWPLGDFVSLLISVPLLLPLSLFFKSGE